jgi:hypothetical protein
MGTLPVLHPPTRGVGKRIEASKPLAKALRALAKALTRGVGKRIEASKPLAKALRALAKALSRGVYTFTKMFQNLIFSLYVLV